MTTERTRDTWSGLIATPLTGRDILQAKMLGALWRLRIYVALTVGVWFLGLATGAIHPLGLILSLAGLAASGWFFAALGVYTGLWSKTPSEPAGLLMLGVCCFCLGGLTLFVLPPRSTSVFFGVGSMPFIGWLSLWSYDDVHVALTTGTFPRLAAAGVATGEGAFRILATCVIGIAGQLIGAFLLTRRAIRGFDAAVGRPDRSTAPMPTHGVMDVSPATVLPCAGH